uniref:PH domain-containing protein n=1 Tax=Macrostomum lignano TaxID=282301 RepID=A0A1I8IWA0_9PLAT
IKLTDVDQQLYRNFNLTVSERWQLEVAEHRLRGGELEEDKIEARRTKWPIESSADVAPGASASDAAAASSDCIVEGEVLRLGGHFQASQKRYLRLFPNRLEMHCKPGLQRKPAVELLAMFDIREVSREFQKFGKHENCILISLKTDQRVYLTCTDRVLAEQWKEEIVAAFEASQTVLSRMNTKAHRWYGADTMDVASASSSAPGSAHLSAPAAAAAESAAAPVSAFDETLMTLPPEWCITTAQGSGPQKKQHWGGSRNGRKRNSRHRRIKNRLMQMTFTIRHWLTPKCTCLTTSPLGSTTSYRRFARSMKLRRLIRFEYRVVEEDQITGLKLLGGGQATLEVLDVVGQVGVLGQLLQRVVDRESEITAEHQVVRREAGHRVHAGAESHQTGREEGVPVVWRTVELLEHLGVKGLRQNNLWRLLAIGQVNQQQAVVLLQVLVVSEQVPLLLRQAQPGVELRLRGFVLDQVEHVADGSVSALGFNELLASHRQLQKISEHSAAWLRGPDSRSLRFNGSRSITRHRLVGVRIRSLRGTLSHNVGALTAAVGVVLEGCWRGGFQVFVQVSLGLQGARVDSLREGCSGSGLGCRVQVRFQETSALSLGAVAGTGLGCRTGFQAVGHARRVLREMSHFRFWRLAQVHQVGSSEWRRDTNTDTGLQKHFAVSGVDDLNVAATFRHRHQSRRCFQSVAAGMQPRLNQLDN